MRSTIQKYLLAGLWRHRPFVTFWSAATISLFGSQITLLALPLTAVLILHASAGQMGLLTALEMLPALGLSLFAGVLVDRLHRRPLLVAADLGRAALLALVPLAALLGMLRMELLYPIALLNGALNLVADLAAGAFLPALVAREQLIEANSRLATSTSVAEVAGPGLASFCVQILTAPFALVLDVLSFLVSGLLLRSLRVVEPPPSTEQHNILREMRAGLQIILREGMLRPIALTSLTMNLFGGAFDALVILYFSQALGLTPLAIGTIFTVGSIGSVAGAILSARLTRWLGMGPAIIGGAILIGMGWSAIPLASGPLPLLLIILSGGRVISGMGNTIYNLVSTSLSQHILPEQMLGRYRASLSFIGIGFLPLGAALGGVVGSVIGLRPALAIAAVGIATGFLWVWCSPLRRLRQPY
jgi:MFS family permease